MNKLKLGCPYYCKDFTCVDVRQIDPQVIKQDVYDYLEITNDIEYEYIYSKNLLEHLPNVGRFLNLCYNNLANNGKLEIITDNAEFIPFYFPFWIKHTGIGAHSNNDYALNHCNSKHYSIFTKMHLINLFEYSRFKNIKAERIMYNARLRIIGQK